MVSSRSAGLPRPRPWRRSSFRYVLLFVVIGLALFAVQEWAYLQGAPVPRLSVLVASRMLQINEPLVVSPLPGANVTIESLDASRTGPDPLIASGGVVPAGITAREPIYPGEVIQRERLFGPGLLVNAAPEEALVRRGYALYTLPARPQDMPLSGLAAGDYVSILATVPLTGAIGTIGAVPALFTSPLRVQVAEPDALVTYVAHNGTALTLALPKNDIPRLMLLAQLGQLSFAQVRPDDPHWAITGVVGRTVGRFYHMSLP